MKKSLRGKLCQIIGLVLINQMICTNLFAQSEPCITMPVDSVRRALNTLPSLHSEELILQQYLQKANHKPQNFRGGSIDTIPVIVHVVHNGDQPGTEENLSQTQVLSQMDVLTEDFRRMLGTNGYNTNLNGADMEIVFCPARVDTNGNPLTEPGINRVYRAQPNWTNTDIELNLKPSTIWNPDQYLNIWTLNFQHPQTLGYSQFPNSSGLTGIAGNNGGATTDGVVVQYNCFGRTGNLQPNHSLGRIATHEMGHFLGLRHIWGDAGCGSDDFCNDTPDSDQGNYGCATGHVSCSTADMIENYMDYTDDVCMNLFTTDQKARVQTVLAISPRRNSLMNSETCRLPGSPPIAEFSTSISAGCTGLPVQYFDQSTGNATSWTWIFPGGSPTTSTQQNPVVTYNTAGIFDVSLTATNSAGSDNEMKTQFIQINNSNQSLPFSENFESGSFQTNGWGLQNNDGEKTWEITTVGGTSIGTQAAYINYFNYTPPGSRDALISPPLNLIGYTNVTLTFEHAYQLYTSTPSDSLIVYVSTDCGATFPNKVLAHAENGSGNFATVPDSTNEFFPSVVNDWCYGGGFGSSCYWVDLSPYSGNQNVKIKFEGYNNFGNNLFLDNILVDGNTTTGPPVADFVANPAIGCSPQVVQFTDISQNTPTTWIWSFPGGTPSSYNGQSPPPITYTGLGTYNVTLLVLNGSGSDNETKQNYIEVNPTLNLSVSPFDAGCGGCTNGYCQAVPSGGTPPYFFNWSHGATTILATSLAAGPYTLTLSDVNGCTVEQNFTIGDPPCYHPTGLNTSPVTLNSARLNWNNVSNAHHYRIQGRIVGAAQWVEIVVPGGASFKDIFGLANGQSYEWQIATFCTLDESVYSIYSPPDTFTTGCQPTDSIWTSNIVSNGALLNWNPVVGAAAYMVRGRKSTNTNWVNILLGNGSTNKAVFGLESNTSYDWMLRSWCDTAGVNVSGFEGPISFTTSGFSRMASPENSNQLLLYPNPVSDHFTVDIEVDGFIHLKVWNSFGQLVYGRTQNPLDQWIVQTQDFEVSTLDWPKGIYLVEVKTKSGIVYGLVVKGE